MSNPVISRETSQAAQSEARHLQAEADRSAKDAAERKQVAQDAARIADATRTAFERDLAGHRHRLADELRQLRKVAEAGIVDGGDDQTRPSIETRVLARLVLRDPAADPLKVLGRLGGLDPIWATRNGHQNAVQLFISRSAEELDDTLLAAADDLEVMCHRAVLDRLRWLAGEAE
jgi:hypothetical protein